MQQHEDYINFLRSKIKLANYDGFEIDPSEVNPILKPHQAACVVWAVRGGNRALFEAFGLGKSVQQIEILRLIKKHAGGKVLVVVPLGVRQEFRRDGEMLGVHFEFIRRAEEMTEGQDFYLTNYESVRDGKLDPNIFTAVSLDEAGVLRSYGSKTYQEFLPLFNKVKYKFVATATPSPNRYKELIHYAGFLGIMDTGQALTRFFQRDSTQANNLTLYPHKEKEFWYWLHSWAIFLQKPSDLGYSDEGYDLPPMQICYHEVATDHSHAGHEKDGQAIMFKDAALGLKGAAHEKRDSMPLRIEKMLEIVRADPDSHYLLWHDLEDERRAIERALPGVKSAYGSMDIDLREQAVIDFSDGKFKYLATKPSVSGSGCNFQRHCHKAIFLGIGYKFHDFIQSCHRIYRFLQEEQVEIHIIHSEAEREVLRSLQTKWTQHREMVEKMGEVIKMHGLNDLSMTDILARTIGVERLQVDGRLFSVANNDCVIEARRQPENNVDLIVTSIPFANHYEYTPSYNDFGHTENNDHFWAQMDFLTPELLRILKPGRLYCCHVKDRILFGNVTGAGAPTVSPFHCEAIMHGRKHGFDYMGMITVVTDVVRENNQTYRLGWSENCKDGTKMGVGSPEYVILFRKPQSDRSRGYSDVPVTKSKDDYTRGRWQVDAHAMWRSSGNRLLTAEDLSLMGPAKLATAFTEYSLSNIYDYEFHVKIGEDLDARGALPSSFMSLAPGSHRDDVWHDINRMLTLNTEQSHKRAMLHVCLASGSLVLTKEGYKPIQSVQVGDMVLTHKGRWRPVQVVRSTGTRPVVTVRAQGVPGLTLTPDHKLWTRKVPGNAWSVAHSRKAAKNTVPRWIEAELTMGSYINQKVPEQVAICITDDELWLIGRWIADGHVETRGGYVVSIGNDKLEEFRMIAKSHAGGESERTATQIRLIGMSDLSKEMLNQCGSGASNKQIPTRLLALPASQSAVLMSGYLSGDGYFLAERNRWCASTVSKKLALGLSMLAQQAYGAIASVYPGRKPGKTTIEGRVVNTLQDWIVSFDVPDSRRKNNLPFVLDDGAWKKVREIDDSGEAETWCLRVEEDESFTAEGCVVKNCPLQFDIVDRLIKRYSNPGELVYDPFCGLGTVPYRALKLGRKGQGSELNTSYFFDSVQYLKAMEQEVSMPDLFDAIEMENIA